VFYTSLREFVPPGLCCCWAGRRNLPDQRRHLPAASILDNWPWILSLIAADLRWERLRCPPAEIVQRNVRRKTSSNTRKLVLDPCVFGDLHSPITFNFYGKRTIDQMEITGQRVFLLAEHCTRRVVRLTGGIQRRASQLQHPRPPRPTYQDLMNAIYILKLHYGRILTDSRQLDPSSKRCSRINLYSSAQSPRGCDYENYMNTQPIPTLCEPSPPRSRADPPWLRSRLRIYRSLYSTSVLYGLLVENITRRRELSSFPAPLWCVAILYACWNGVDLL